MKERKLDWEFIYFRSHTVETYESRRQTMKREMNNKLTSQESLYDSHLNFGSEVDVLL